MDGCSTSKYHLHQTTKYSKNKSLNLLCVYDPETIKQNQNVFLYFYGEPFISPSFIFSPGHACHQVKYPHRERERKIKIALITGRSISRSLTHSSPWPWKLDLSDLTDSCFDIPRVVVIIERGGLPPSSFPTTTLPF